LGLEGSYDNNSSGGYYGGDINWGVIANHRFNGGALSLNYRGDYRDYSGVQGYSGTDQNLGFAISKILSKHWSVSYSQTAGIYLSGASYFSLQPAETNLVQVNPYSSTTKFLSSGVSASYQQSLRLSYVFSGSYYLSRYSGNAPYGISGVTASGGLNYRITPRTTVSGTYSFSDYQYQQLGGQAQVHTFYATLSHLFANHWSVLGSAGVSRSQSSGTIDYALSPGLAQLLGASFVAGPYNTTTLVPYFQASASRQMRHSTVSFIGSQSITPGNGIYLASKNLAVTGLYSYTWRLSSVGFAGGYSRLGSAANAARPIDMEFFSASYGRPLARYLGLTLRYDFFYYPSVVGLVPFDRDSRFTFGIVFNSKSVPITLF
jgi:hypothetical protein